MTPGAVARLAEILIELLRRRGDDSGRGWLESSAARSGAFDSNLLASSFATAGRRLGRSPLNPDPDEIARLRDAGIDWRVEGWGLDETGRIALLLDAAGRVADDRLAALVEDLYRHGELRERQAILKALPLLPHPERHVAVGVEAGRSHMQSVFEAIACENPYPARHFPDVSFNQMVLKALFTGVALARIVGMERRVTPELSRMARAYASERTAAGRPVPADIGLVTER